MIWINRIGLWLSRLWFLPLLAALAGCGRAPALPLQARVQPTATDCGCTLKVTPFPTQKGGLAQAGPQAVVTGTPAGTASAGGGWMTYLSPAGGFAFDYPAVFASQDHPSCAPREAGQAGTVALGERTTITVTPSDQSLEAAAAAFRAEPAHQKDQFDQPVQRRVGGVAAVTLAYRSAGMGRYAEATLFIKDGRLYRVESAGSPSTCDAPSQGVTELSAYAHVLDTFKFK